MLKSEDEA
jgi:hypothetical protein